MAVERKGYGERLGLTFGLLLSAIGLLIVLLLPGRPRCSKWKTKGPLPMVTAAVAARNAFARTDASSGDPPP